MPESPFLVCNFIKEETLTQVFPVNFAKLLRARFIQNTSGRLLQENIKDLLSFVLSRLFL